MTEQETDDCKLALFAFVFEDAPDATVVFDAAGRLLVLNRAARELPDELVEILASGDLPHAGELSRFRAELTSEGRALAEIRVGGRAMAIDGKMHGTRQVVTLRDITERLRLESELRALQRVQSIGHFTASLIHDFNNLLTPIACLSACLEEQASLDDAARAMAGDIRDAAQRATVLARQTLQLVRREPSRAQIADVNLVVDELRSLIERVVGSEIHVELVLAKDAGAAMLDRERLEHALLNLAANARDAMPTGGLLRLSTTKISLDEGGAAAIEGARVGAYVALRVTDTGVGMTTEVRERIFEHFFTTKEAGRGTGLGLASVRRFVAESGGAIALHSEEGRGTTMSLYLPSVEPRARASKRESTRTPSLGSETVLVVDDDARVRGAVRAVLEAHGYRVLDAAGGEDALAIARGFDGPIHLAVVDIIMPQMTGRELARHIRTLRPTKVLFTSGHTERRLEGHGWKTDDGPLLKKAFTPSELLLRVREVIGG